MRIDVALVNMGLFESRNRAANAVRAGAVFYDNKPVAKPSFDAENPDLISVRDAAVMPFVSRGGLKLEHALNTFHINMTGRRMVDIGSSTGGFCDVALRAGVGHIVAVDVGTDQMHKSLRRHPQIDLHEQTDFRDLDDELLKNVDFATIDVSFISVTKILDKLASMPRLRDVVCLIKPQFECGPEISARFRGVIRDVAVRDAAVDTVTAAFAAHGFRREELTQSPIAGGSGNIEFLAHFVRGV